MRDNLPIASRRWTQMNADGGLIRVHPRFVSCPPQEKSRKTFGRVLTITEAKMSKKIAEQLLSEVEHLRHQLKESEMLHQTLVQTNLYGIQEIDVYGNIVYTNSVLCEILGYSGGGAQRKADMESACV